MDKDRHDERSFVNNIKETILLFFTVVTSKTALRTYLSTLLFFCLTIGLLALSSVAYWLLYNRFIPQPQIEKVIHLQFGDAPHPYGTAYLAISSISSLTPYDISVSLLLPRTPTNLAAGNFMLDVSLHGPPQDAPSNAFTGLLASSQDLSNKGTLVAHSRRPAILTYASPVVDTVSTLTWLTFYLFGWASESERLQIPMFEAVEFNKGTANLPQSITIALEAFPNESPRHVLQVYDCHVKIVAKLRGLKWIMYHHRILSYVAFTACFWGASVMSFAVTYLTATLVLESSEGKEAEQKRRVMANEQDFYAGTQPPIKAEEGMSDTPRTFPSLGRVGGGAVPLRYPDSRVKQEVEEEEEGEKEILQATTLQPLEADDEDEGFEEGTESFRDSGIGTGRDEARERANVVQRRRRALFGGGSGGGGGR